MVFVAVSSLFPTGFSSAIYSPIDYFQITYSPAVFSKTTITNGNAFNATIKSRGVAFINPPSSADAVRFSYRYSGANKSTGEEVVLNPLQTLTVEPFPQKRGESYEATNVVSLRFPAGSQAGDYTIIEEIINIEMKDSGLGWQNAPKPSKPPAPTKPSAPTPPAPPTKPSAPTQPSAPTKPSRPEGGMESGGVKPSKPAEPTRPPEPTKPSEPTRA